MKREEFLRLAKEKFGDKIEVKGLTLSKESLERINEGSNFNFSASDFESYPEQAWLIGDDCPHCGEDLLGLFGNFKWGIVHGEGHCGGCDKVYFRMYHYIVERRRPIQLLSVVGF